MFNATHDAIFLHDAVTGAILDVNRTTLAMFGYEREELLNADRQATLCRRGVLPSGSRAANPAGGRGRSPGL